MLPSLSISLLLALAVSVNHVTSQDDVAIAPRSPKRGLVFVPFDEYPEDNAVWVRGNSDLTWYYNYQDHPSIELSNIPQSRFEFVPMMWGVRDDDPSDTTFLDDVRVLVAEQEVNITHALAFNEPDGTMSTGGSSLAPEVAAKAWIANFEPLRRMGIQVGLPAVTGSSDGLPWLRAFLEKCSDELTSSSSSSSGSGDDDKRVECEFDFVPVHWYGNFEGLASHIGERVAAFPGKDIWVTEFAFADQSLDDTQEFFNNSISYLDRVPEVARYSYFGAFRSHRSNVGPDASFLNRDGDVTDVGAWYLGFGATGVYPQSGEGAGTTVVVVRLGRVVAMIGLVWLIV